jgi:Protein of unknown function (DUF2807).
MKNLTIFSKFSFCFLFLLTTTTASAQWGNDDRIEEDRKVGNFDAVSVGYGIDVHLDQSNQTSVSVKAKKETMKHIITEVKNGTLIIKIDNWKKRIKGGMDITIHVPNLDKISASGGSDVYGKGNWKMDDLVINLSGGSDLEMELVANKLECNASGGSDIDLKGSADKIKINCSGGSDIEARKFIVKHCTVNASGGSDVEVYASESINASASGASDITYKGNPSEVKVHSSGSSDISN